MSWSPRRARPPTPVAEIRSDATDGGAWTVSGEMVFDTVCSLLEQGKAMFGAGGPALRLDLREVVRVDSAGLALLLEWFKAARRCGQDIVFVNVPEQMLAMAGISDLDRVLPFQPGT